MSRRSTVLAAVAALVLVAGCGSGGPDPAAAEATGLEGPGGAPGASGPLGDGTPMSLCDLVDLATAGRVATDLALVNADRGTPRLVSSAVYSAPLAESCTFAPDIGINAPLVVVFYPGDRPPEEDTPTGAEPRPDLGTGAYFVDARNGFHLAAELGGIFTLLFAHTEIDAEFPHPVDAETAMRGLLSAVASALPPQPVLAGRLAGEKCAALETATAEVLGATIEFSRQVEIGAFYQCSFMSPTAGTTVGVSSRPGEAERLRAVVTQRGVPLDLDDAWLISADSAATVYLFSAPDAITVSMCCDEAEGVYDEPLTELATALVSLLIRR